MEIDELFNTHANVKGDTTPCWTRNSEFDENGFLYLKDLYDPKKLTLPILKESGLYRYWGKKENEYEFSVENQVAGSTSRYWHPHYKKAHTDIRNIIENKIGRKLYNTYYFDRTYFSGNYLSKHVDRGACEISVSIHISSNINEHWPIFMESPNGQVGVILDPGDGVLYKGCAIPHWRDAMITGENFYYHQIFFHYVLQDGYKAQFAFDRGH